MGRALRVQQDIYPYHVSTRTNRQEFVLKKWTYKLIIKVLVEAVQRYNAKIHHFKMMHNHYHMLISTPNENISQIMWFINNRIAKKFNWRSGLKGSLWGERFCSSIVENDKYANQCVHYIYTNGVRANLCDTAAEDDQFSTFAFYARGKRIEFTVTEDDVFLLMGSDRKKRQENFRRMFETDMTSSMIDSIKKRLKKPFFGSGDFIVRMTKKYYG